MAIMTDAEPQTLAGRALVDVTFRGEDGSFDLSDPIPPADHATLLTAILAIEREAAAKALDVERLARAMSAMPEGPFEVADIAAKYAALESKKG